MSALIDPETRFITNGTTVATCSGNLPVGCWEITAAEYEERLAAAAAGTQAILQRAEEAKFEKLAKASGVPVEALRELLQ